ncbi:Ppx/GppA phosphatase family protein [Clostridium sp. LBM24168]
MNRLAVIDIGSNSMRAIIVKIFKNRSYEIIDELKATVRLGKDMTKEGNLNSDRTKVALKVLSYFKRLCDSNEVDEIIAVATEAVRKAKNQAEFLNMAKGDTGINIRVLTGQEEAYHDYLGVINSIDVDSALLMDIGGSSTELVFVKERNVQKSISIPMGAITLTDNFLSLTGSKQKKLKELVKYLNDTFDSIDWLKDVKGIPLIGIGGSFRTLGKVHRNKYSYPLNNSHNYHINSKSIFELYDSLKYMDISQYKRIKGISKERADIFYGALISIVSIIKYCKLKNVIISENGLRQGIIYRMLLDDYPPVVKNILDFSLNNISSKFGLNKKHIKQVWNLCRKLSENISEILNFPRENYKILKTAAYLNDCGISIGFDSHEKYSFYIVKDLKIYGVTHREQLMAAFVVSDFEDYKIKDSKYFNSIIRNEDILLINQMSVILHIAEGLDRAMDGNILDIESNINKDSVVLKLISKKEPLLEIDAVSDYGYDFENIFGKRLVMK